MLRSISWMQFGSFLLVTGGGYYLYVLVRFYRKEFMTFLSGKKSRTEKICAMLGTVLLISLAGYAQTADGNAGINQANTLVRGYYADAVPLMYAVGGIVGIIGAIRVYLLWSHGDPHTGKVAAAWFSACIFLVLVATVIQSFFGL
jgi:hypothetical protein